MFESEFVKATLTPILAIVGSLFGLVGTALGILNYRLSRKRDQVALRVSGGSRLTTSQNAFESLDLQFKIVNAGYAAVTVGEIGLRIKMGRFRCVDIPLDSSPLPNLAPQKDLVPKRIEPHDECVIWKRLSKANFFKYQTPTYPRVGKAVALYVATSVGKKFYGKGRYLESFVEKAVENEGALYK